MRVDKGEGGPLGSFAWSCPTARVTDVEEHSG